MFRGCAILTGLALIHTASGQFAPDFLQNDSYWGDGKAEVDFYDAQMFREGQLRPCEVTLIFQWDKFIPHPGKDDLTPPQTPEKEIPAVSMKEVFTAAVGLINRQESTTLFWARDNHLLHACGSRTGADGITFFQTNFVPQLNSVSISRNNERGSGSWQHIANFPGPPDVPNVFSATPSPTTAIPTSSVAQPFGVAPKLTPRSSPENKLFLYEELPLRVRTIAFAKAAGEFEINLLSPLDRTKDSEEFFSGQTDSHSAKVSYKAGERAIEVDVRYDGKTDHFLLDSNFPYLLREWQMADGSRLKMKNSLKVDYTKFLKNGDREKAFKDPMLRHPD